MHQVSGDEINRYFVSEKMFERKEDFPYNVSPLAFMDYDEANIIKKIGSLGWIAPVGLDANSTNCIMNSYANQVHIEKLGFHPYVFEIAGMVRSGVMGRQEGYEKIYKILDDKEAVACVKIKLGLVP